MVMSQEITEHLIKCSEKVARVEEEYLNAKQELDIKKAKFILSDWEKLLGKAKSTQKEKDAFIELSTTDEKKKVNDLKVKLDYCKRIHEIEIMQQKY